MFFKRAKIKEKDAFQEKKTLQNVEDYLPIGSVVLLKEGDKKLMIFGIQQCNNDKKFAEYDYIGVLYPEGRIDDEHQYLFYHKDIEQVFFRGCEDKERQEFVEKLKNL